MNNNQHKPQLSWGLFSVFLFVSVVLIVLGILFINSQKEHLLKDKENELLTVANLKVEQIRQWRNAKMADANLIHDNLSMVGQIHDFLNESDSVIQKHELIKWMNSLIKNYDYLSANIIDAKGKVRLSVPGEDSIIGPTLKPLISLALYNQKIILTDLHRMMVKGYIHLDLIIPMVSAGSSDSTAIGLIVLRINPKKNLYPLVQTWPTPSRSAETLLLRREGDSLLYLNDLKHLSNSGLSLRKSVNSDRLIGAKAVLGFDGIAEGVDYRNVEVIAAIKKIPDSPWYMISKVDKMEIDNSFSQQLLYARLLIIFFISAFGAIIGWLVWDQRVRYYRQRYESEVERLAVRKHFDYILKYANDIILLIDHDLTIIEVNDRAVERYMYPREEMIGMKIMNLRLPELSAQLDDQIKILNDTSYSRYETVHRCKDGSTFQLEISARLVEIEGIKYYQSIGRDITERKKAENLLREREFWLTESQRVGKIGSYILDIKSNEWTSSEVLDEIFGIPRNAPKTLESWNLIVHPDQREEMLNYFLHHVIEKKNSFEKEYRILKHNSIEDCWVWGRGELSYDAEGNPEKMFGTIQDITERKISEILIIESEERFRKVFEESPISTAMTAGSYNIIRVNSSFCKMLGFEENEIIECTFRDFTHPDHVNTDEKFLFELIDGKIPIYKTEKKYIRKDKSIIWGSTTVSVIRDRNGKVQYFLVMIEDITQRKEAEIKIEESNSILRATLESTADGILVVDLKGKIVQYNRKFTELWKIPDNILNTRDDEKALSFVRDQLKEPDTFLDNVKHLYENPEAVSFDVLEFSDGRVFERYSQPQRISNEILGRVWSFRDVTQSKIAENQLVNAKEKAEESDKLKTAFLHNISHEIRTPMNAIVGFTALLDDDELLTVPRKQYIDIIYQSSNQLLSIISDIVDISNIEIGQTKVTLARVNINSTILNLFEQFNLRATTQGLTLKYQLSLNDDEALMETDVTKLIQVLSNLLNNALKFTKAGSIVFGYTLNDGLIEFMVRDTGIGISKDKQTKIFERFYQVENSISRQYGGTGLGLSICRAYVELLGGDIRVESTPGEGSIFYFSIPFKPGLKVINIIESDHRKPEGLVTGKTVLIAEDDDINFLVVKKTLEAKNLNLIRAVNGQEAIDSCRKISEISLVLLDLKMPVMDGLEAMKLIKEFRPELPFIALTAFAFESDKKNAMEKGCSDYISKPFSKKELLEVLGKYL